MLQFHLIFGQRSCFIGKNVFNLSQRFVDGHSVNAYFMVILKAVVVLAYKVAVQHFAKFYGDQ